MSKINKDKDYDDDEWARKSTRSYNKIVSSSEGKETKEKVFTDYENGDKSMEYELIKLLNLKTYNYEKHFYLYIKSENALFKRVVVSHFKKENKKSSKFKLQERAVDEHLINLSSPSYNNIWFYKTVNGRFDIGGYYDANGDIMWKITFDPMKRRERLRIKFAGDNHSRILKSNFDFQSLFNMTNPYK